MYSVFYQVPEADASGVSERKDRNFLEIGTYKKINTLAINRSCHFITYSFSVSICITTRIQSFIHLSNKYFLNSNSNLGTISGLGSSVNQKDKKSLLLLLRKS